MNNKIRAIGRNENQQIRQKLHGKSLPSFKKAVKNWVCSCIPCTSASTCPENQLSRITIISNKGNDYKLQSFIKSKREKISKKFAMVYYVLVETTLNRPSPIV